MPNPRSRPNYHWVRLSPPGARPRRRLRDFAGRLKTILGFAPAEAPDTLSRFSFANALAEIGVPATTLSPEDELIQLLQEAAEVEHELLLQYLYSSYSLIPPKIAGSVRLIAIEEMGHFVTVQNLLGACGGAIHFDRGGPGQGAAFQPFEFRLEPASSSALAKYTVAEMPDIDLIPAGIKVDLPTIISEGEGAAGGSVQSHRVGLLYAKIYWLLRQSDAALADPAQEPWSGFPVTEMAANHELAGRHVRDGFVTDTTAVNAAPAQWRGNYNSVIVEPISGREAALHAIASIAAQGEGFNGVAQSHFERFVDAWRSARTQTDLALAVPVNPFVGAAVGMSDNGAEITSISGRQFALISDRAYELVLLCVAASLLLPPGTAPEIRGSIAQGAIAAMRGNLSDLSGALAQIPVADATQTPVCGLPFAVPAAVITPDLRLIRDRARAVITEMKALIVAAGQGTADPTLQMIAAGIGETLDDPILPAIEALPV